jgi:hypothetical protein
VSEPDGDQVNAYVAPATTIVTVTHCGVCPWASDGTDVGVDQPLWTCHCEYDENGWPRHLPAPQDYTPPDWCPLRAGPRLVQLRPWPKKTWTGPLESDLAPDGVSLRHTVPPERWPYGWPDAHEACCSLQRGGPYCDCLASDASDDEHGESP